MPQWRQPKRHSRTSEKDNPLARSRVLFRLKALLEENFEEVSRIQTMEHGRSLTNHEAKREGGFENVEVACVVFQHCAATIQRILPAALMNGLSIAFRSLRDCRSFQFPFMIPLWSAPYAVATGNTVVIKPSARVP